MRRTITQAILYPTLLFTAVMILMRLSPYQDGGLYALLTPPENCAAPCWLGIRPGSTSLDGSSQILAQSGLIKTVRAISPATSLLQFSTSVPALRRGTLNLWNGQTGVVSQITLADTGLSLSDIQLAFGAPRRLFLNRTIQYGLSRLMAVYPQHNLVITGDIHACQVNQDTLWKEMTNVHITIGDWQTAINDPSGAYISSAELNPSRWATQLRQLQLCFA